jgi:rhamnose transport system permease protein
MMSAARARTFNPASLARWELLLVLLLIVGVAISANLSDSFLSVFNFTHMPTEVTYIGVMVLPMTLIIISGNIDLSVDSTIGLTATVLASVWAAGWDIWLASLLALLVGAVAGCANGMIITRLKLPSLVVTLGTLALYRGLAFIILGDHSIPDSGVLPAGFLRLDNYFLGYVGPFDLGFLQFPGKRLAVSLVIFLILAVAFGLLLHRTAFGRYIYAIGNNALACRYTGVPVDGVVVTLFTLSGLMAALGGILLMSFQGDARADMGSGFLLNVITAVVLGGVNIFGGEGTIVGPVLALCLIEVLQSGMRLRTPPVDPSIQTLLIGALLIASLLVPNLVRRAREALGPVARRRLVGRPARDEGG